MGHDAAGNLVSSARDTKTRETYIITGNGISNLLRKCGGSSFAKAPDPSQRNGGAASDDVIRIFQCLEQLGPR